MIRSGNIRGAAEVVKRSNALANVCGNICPEEVFCQPVCNRSSLDSPIRIRELHQYATGREAELGYSPVRALAPNGRRVAVVGAGPAGLSCAFELAKLGYGVTLFDKSDPGGIPRSSIPSFRLSDAGLRADLEFLTGHFTFMREEVDEGKLAGLKRKYDAVFLAVGLGHDRPLCIPGEKLDGVIPVLRFLERAKSGHSPVRPGASVVIVGGGNVSLDAASTAKRLGASYVLVLYRRSESQMKVWKSELEEARRQGVEFRFLTLPIEIISDGEGRASRLRCRNTRLSRSRDGSGRPIPVEIPDSEHEIPADMVVIAIGQELPPGAFGRLKRNGRGYLDVGRGFHTSSPGVFAGGDAIAGEGTIVQSVSHGKEAARNIDSYLRRKAAVRRRNAS
jgi:glutamate synthase (NADPH/NADH) small chain